MLPLSNCCEAVSLCSSASCCCSSSSNAEYAHDEPARPTAEGGDREGGATTVTALECCIGASDVSSSGGSEAVTPATSSGGTAMYCARKLVSSTREHWPAELDVFVCHTPPRPTTSPPRSDWLPLCNSAPVMAARSDWLPLCSCCGRVAAPPCINARGQGGGYQWRARCRPKKRRYPKVGFVTAIFTHKRRRRFC